MRTKLFGLIGIVLLLLVVELLARGCLDYHVSKSIMNKTANVRKVTVASGDVPVVFYEGVLGHISNGSITMHDIVADPISMAQLDVSASKIDLSRGSLISSKAKITGTPPYLLTVILSKENLRQVINRPVTFHSSYVQTSVDNHVIDVQSQVRTAGSSSSKTARTQCASPCRARTTCRASRRGSGSTEPCN